MTPIIRTRVLDLIKDLFVTMDAALPVGDPYEVEWSIVTRDPIRQLTKGKVRALGVYAGESIRTEKFPFLHVMLPVVIEVHAAKQSGVDMSRTIEDLLGVVERRLKEGMNDGQPLRAYVHDLKITGEQVTVDGAYDNQAEGALFLTLTFSQREDDPRLGRT